MSGTKLIGPKRAGPINPVVVVLTPSMDFDRNDTSSTYTPGARYSGMPFSLTVYGGGTAGVINNFEGNAWSFDRTTSSSPNLSVAPVSRWLCVESIHSVAACCEKIAHRSGIVGVGLRRV